MATRDHPVSLRITREEHNELKARAHDAGMSLTAFLVAAGLGTVRSQPSAIEQHFAALEDQIASLADQISGLDRRLSPIEDLAGR